MVLTSLVARPVALSPHTDDGVEPGDDVGEFGVHSLHLLVDAVEAGGAVVEAAFQKLHFLV